jgi:carbon-monoxide dehydrogenase medium subunit
VQAFEYHQPKTVKEAIEILRKQPKAIVLAGGTDMLVRMKDRILRPPAVVDCKRLPGVTDISYTAKGGLKLGSAVTMRQVELSSVAVKRYGAIAQGATFVGSIQIRNRATLVGNVCNAAPSADTAPGLIVHNAKVQIAGPRGRRTMAVEDFMKGPGKNDLGRGEFVIGIQVPAPKTRTGSAYVRHTPREAMDIAVVGVGAAITLTAKGICTDAKICLGAVAPVPLRATGAEAVLIGEQLTPAKVKQAALVAGEEARPITDVRATEEFRREMVRVLTTRMIQAASKAATGTKARRAA